MTVTAIADSCFGDDQVWPPGFRFHPTDEELVLYYLKRKICKKKLKLDIIRDTDVYKWDPEELPAQSMLKSGDRQWFFFTPRDRKYTNGARANRATEHGYWKATGKDRAVTCDSRTVGVKKTLVFYRGRAPTGERTDWVMHEYTLDEEELKRCQNVKEYYALYKLYKKSGPGPKNGEQYGAPFKEEEWDDEYVSNPVVTITPVMPPNEANSGYNVKANDQVACLSNDDGEYMRQLINESALPLPEGHFGYVLPKVVGNGGTQSTMMDPSLRDVLLRESRVVHHDQASFEFTQPPISQLKLHQSPEVTSVPGHFEQVPEFCELDYLEIDDLSSSQLLNSTVVEPVVNGQQFNVLDGPSEVDVYHDTVDFPQGTGTIDQGTVPFSYENMINHVSYPLESQSNISLMDQRLQSQTNINFMDRQFEHHSNINLMNQQWPHQFNAFGDNQQSESQFNAFGDNQHLQPQSNALGDNMLNQVGYQYPSFPNINLMDQQWIPYSTTDQVDDQLQFQSVGNETDQHLHMDQINGSLWAHDQSANVFTASGSNLGNVSPIAGSVHNGIDQDQGDKSGDGGGGGSRFSSAMWSILESIPTTPASASEGPLVNQAIERMSRLRLNARITDISAVNGAATAKRKVRNSGFFFISMLGALCAILWFLIGNGLGSKENLLMKKFF